MKVVYMGTPDFSVGALEAIIHSPHEVTAVVTQPDKPRGRSKELQISPVKACALKYNIPVFQPAKIKEADAVEYLRKLEADIFVVAAFGQILSKEILTMPKHGCVNIHASLLPKYRGASPIQWAVINGEKESGVTIMQMDEGIDTGDILMQEKVTLDAKETGESLFDKLAVCGADLIVKALDAIEANAVMPIKQDELLSTHVGMLKKEFGRMDFTQDAVALERKIRGLNSWPSAYTYYKGKTLKIWDADVVDTDDYAKAQPGEICDVSKDTIFVKTAKGLLAIKEVQLEGKKRMDVKSFLLGNVIESGIVFPN